MKKILPLAIIILQAFFVNAQNTFPATGNVGIGTSSPQSLLDINANGTIPIIRGNGGYIPTGFRFIDDSYTAKGQIKEWAIFKGNTWLKGLGFVRYDAVDACNTGICDLSFLLSDNGNVGISTSNPSEKLHLGSGNFKIQNGDLMLFNGNNRLTGHDDRNNYFIGDYPVSGSSGLNVHWHGGIKFGTSSGDVMQILQNGNVGIGTNSPGAKLEVNGNINTSQGAGGKIILFDNNSTRNNRIELFADENGANIGSTYSTGGNGNINFNTIGTTKMRILENGNIGIGTTTPVSKLDLGSNYSDPSSYPNKISLWSGGPNNYFGFGISEGDLDYFSQGNHRFFVGYNGTPGREVLTLKANGNAALQGKLEAKEIKVTNSPTADFVFEETYTLPKLEEVEKHIKEKKHLPEIASAKEMEKDGVNVGEFQIKLLQKIEELTLYVIDQNKKIKELENDLKESKSKK